MEKKKMIYVILLFLCSALGATAQKKMVVQDEDLGLAVARTEENETVVIVRSPLELTFESTMDKTVEVYNTEQESGFNKYYIRFSTLPKYRGRKLKIKSYGFDTYTHPLELTAKVPVGIYVVDPDGEIGLTCYQQNLNAGNRLFQECLYDDAQIAYFDALECSDLPEENIIGQKIEDAMNCGEYRRMADDLYTNQDWVAAKGYYERVVALNQSDQHSAERIDNCQESIDNMPRTITGTVTDASGNPIPGVRIRAEYVKIDKKGRIERDKEGNPKTEFKDVGTTDDFGEYSITVLNKSRKLLFSGGNLLTDVNYKNNEVVITDSEINVTMSQQLSGRDVEGILKGGAEILKLF
ncbi:hypothetical protein M2480_002400 [Parabacteroides sp. PFB2-12]|uniref:carboxypeptidase-like regulatory domain-containing protein n=1 Tax=unclassified Parabacteroides TaxID=2649774 RepID=UPI002475BAAD|nr:MULTISPECIES: carboxypeptidase-like regulatory domain-containing protein [unclassified Parabacteroides]MDH6343614.1 hypothetical protein [Parabacteroides sp. PM6-13]MDH6391405.1 hypothetical protein [Parabacteroides sp. PFB2-12]